MPSRALARRRQSTRGLRRPGGDAVGQLASGATQASASGGLWTHRGDRWLGRKEHIDRQPGGGEAGETSTVQGSFGAEGACPGQWVLLNKVLILWADMESGAGAQLLRRGRRGAEPPPHPSSLALRLSPANRQVTDTQRLSAV